MEYLETNNIEIREFLTYYQGFYRTKGNFWQSVGISTNLEDVERIVKSYDTGLDNEEIKIVSFKLPV